jgi:hypothetical protein
MLTSQQMCFNKQYSEKYIYIQLICITKTRNGKLVALGWKQPLQENLDIFSVLWNSVRSGEKGIFTRPNIW